MTVFYEEGIGNSSFPDIGFDAAYSPDGKRIALTGGLGTTRLWDTDSGEEVLVLRGHTGSVVAVAFSPDGRQIATASVDGTVKVWDAVTGVNLLTLPVDSQGAGGISFRLDGKQLAVGAVPVSTFCFASRGSNRTDKVAPDLFSNDRGVPAISAS